MGPKVSKRYVDANQVLIRRLGAYRLQFDDQGFALIDTRAARGTLPWGAIIRVRQTHEFDTIVCAKLDRKDKAYYIPKHSDAIGAQQYQHGLNLFLSRIPELAISEPIFSSSY